jgi:hypothetical protein
MRNRLVFAAVLVAIVVIAVLWPRPDSTRVTHEPAPSASAATTPQTAQSPPLANSLEIKGTAPARPSQNDITPAADAPGTFRSDANGQLIVDEQTRLDMEALFARTDAADLPQALDEITRKLPPPAAAEASALLERYQNYSKAQRQAYPPGAAPATEEAALAELEGLHALRVAHFGADIAQALYGDEEALTRSLIELMRLEKDQSLTLEEKAARAQRLYDTLPELSRVQRSN